MNTPDPNVAPNPFSPLFLDHFESKEIVSSTNGHTYRINVQLPLGYRDSDETYPVLYALDAEFLFGMQALIPFVLDAGGVTPKLIIVGPAYGTSTPAELLATRERDYTPSADPERPGSGGGREFLGFLEKDVIPFVETSYRARPEQRALWGYSLGGLFALYALFTRPGLFHAYLATSPSLWWHGGVLLDIEERYAARHRDLPARLFTSVGALEGADPYVKPWTRLTSTLRGREYKGFELRPRMLDGHGHFSGFASSYVEGLMTLFGTGTERTDGFGMHRIRPADADRTSESRSRQAPDTLEPIA